MRRVTVSVRVHVSCMQTCRSLLTLALLDTAKMARLEKRVTEGLLLDPGLRSMEQPLYPAGGLLQLGEDVNIEGGDGGWL